MSSLRLCEKFINNEWIKCNIMDLTKGDQFRLYENEDHTEFVCEGIAADEPYRDSAGLATISVNK